MMRLKEGRREAAMRPIRESRLVWFIVLLFVVSMLHDFIRFFFNAWGDAFILSMGGSRGVAVFARFASRISADVWILAKFIKIYPYPEGGCGRMDGRSARLR